MKELRASASATVTASPERALDLLEDVGGYPRWYPDVVRDVEVVREDARGRPRRARATLHATVGPINRDFELLLDVARDGDTVALERVAHGAADRERFEVVWEVAPAGSGARIDLRLEAALEVPRLVPVGGLGDSLASGFVAAAARELGGGPAGSGRQ
ncbi:MAG TPA: SRPBCC family protein [Solirubrobacteraceae bacterium]|nr:SRPBCC family protein [Solirubrobacteraceae bacterium]